MSGPVPARRVAVVTDSTAYLPDDLAGLHDVTVVPLQVALDGRAGEEGLDVTPADVAAALRGRAAVTTSRPSPQTFRDTYERAAKEHEVGALVSIHLSGELSGTLEAAHLAAAELPDLDVRVVDSRSIGMGLGFPVVAAAEAAAGGADADQVVAAALEQVATTSTLFYVDTLEHLRRGGRIGQAAALLGSALMVKPLLHVVDGVISPLEKVRTASRALARLEDLVVELAAAQAAAGRRVAVAVHHLAAPDRAAELAAALDARVPALASLATSEVGAVVGAHCGPGLVAVVVAGV